MWYMGACPGHYTVIYYAMDLYAEDDVITKNRHVHLNIQATEQLVGTTIPTKLK